MDRLREVAFQTIGRAVGFAGLAILCVMAGLAFDPLMAVRAGGILVLLVLFVLLIKARNALSVDYKSTEMWLYLEKDEKPAEAYAQWAASTVLREAYMWFARWTAGVAVVLWAIAILLSLLGVKGDPAFAKPQPAVDYTVSPGTETLFPQTQQPYPIRENVRHLVP